VAARSPEDDAAVVLELAGEGDDAMAVARAFAEGPGREFVLEPQETTLGSRRAVRARGRSRGTTLDVTWLARDGMIYQLTGICPNEKYDGYQRPFIDVALGLRGLTDEERDGVMVDRLRIARARGGESLEALLERTGSKWGPEQTAVANALDANEPLSSGARIKVPLQQRYAGSG
jgi:predicted Zn-dependent protease